MKSLIIVNEQVWEETGIGKKIIAQHDALRRIAGSCTLVKYVTKNGRTFRTDQNDTIIDKLGDVRIGYLLGQFKYGNLFKYIISHQIEMVYIRYNHFSNPSFNRFLAKLKSQGILVVIEVPTYPYDSESQVKFGFNGVKKLVERVCRQRMYRSVDLLATFSMDEFIFNIPCVNISNAVDPKQNPLGANTNKETIRFVGIANLAFWHGYDRMICSVAKYYRSLHWKERIEFHIVGGGAIEKNLKDLAREQGVSDYIFFHGNLKCEQLDDVFRICHIGVDSLGRHRSGNLFNNSLKSKEYLMRGLPLIKSHVDTTIERCPFVMDVLPNDDTFDLQDIIDWYLKNDFKAKSIRNYALERFTWDNQMEKVLAQLAEQASF